MFPSPSRSNGVKQIAVVGAGYFSQFHFDAWARMNDVKVVAVCDPDRERARSASERYGVDSVFTDVAAMLDAGHYDLIDVVIPPSGQAAVLPLLIQRRIPTICQKPFGTSYGQAEAFASQATALRSLLVVHENFRFMPWFREARRLIDNGWLGTLHGISFRLRPGDGQGPRAYLDRQPYFQAMPRLLVVETAIHFIDTFRYLMGEIKAVYASLRRLNPAIKGEDAALITFEFEDGSAGLFDGNRLNEHVASDPRRTMGEMWVDGSAGVLRLDGEARLWWKPHHGLEHEHVYSRGEGLGYGGGACLALQQHTVQSLSEKKEPENTAQAYLRNLLVQEAIYASHNNGERILIDAFNPPAFQPA